MLRLPGPPAASPSPAAAPPNWHLYSCQRTAWCARWLTLPAWPPCRRSRRSARSTPRASWRTSSPTTRPPAATSRCRARYNHSVIEVVVHCDNGVRGVLYRVSESNQIRHPSTSSAVHVHTQQLCNMLASGTHVALAHSSGFITQILERPEDRHYYFNSCRTPWRLAVYYS